MRSLQLNFTDELLEAAVTASNVINIIKKHDKKSLGLVSQGPGGHSRNSFSDKDRAKVKRWISAQRPFEKRDGTLKVVYNQKLPSMYVNIDVEGYKQLVATKKREYTLHKTP